MFGVAPVPVHSLVEENGKTIRENNLELKHNVPLGAVVDVEFDHLAMRGINWKGTARLYVVAHDRDCDGTPLYVLADSPIGPPPPSKTYAGVYSEEWRWWNTFAKFSLRGYGEDSLKVTGETAETFYPNVETFMKMLAG